MLQKLKLMFNLEIIAVQRNTMALAQEEEGQAAAAAAIAAAESLGADMAAPPSTETSTSLAPPTGAKGKTKPDAAGKLNGRRHLNPC